MALTKVSYSMINGPVANAADYGWIASATGAANYTAIKAAYDSGAAIIRLPAGTFSMAQTLYIDRGVCIEGSGAQDGSGNNGQSAGVASTSINYTGTGNAFDLVGSYTEGVSNIHLSNFMITGNALADGGIYVGSGIVVSKSTFKNIGIFAFTNANANKGYGLGIKNCLESIFENVYVHGCHDGINIGFGQATTLEFHSCYSRVNNQYGWNIRQGNGSSFYQCLAEGNLKTGLVINPSTGQFVTNHAFYSWYSEANGIDADTYPGAAVITSGSGSCNYVQFYSPVFYDSSTYNNGAGNWTIACIKLGNVNNISFQNGVLVSINPNFIECTASTSACSWQGYGGGTPQTNITNNTYHQTTGIWSVQIAPAVTPDFEIGTWVPVVTSGGTQVAGQRVGQFQKNGQVVTFQGAIQITDITAALVIDGLPYIQNSSYGNGMVNGSAISPSNFAYQTSVAGTTISIDYVTTYSSVAISIYFTGNYFV